MPWKRASAQSLGWSNKLPGWRGNNTMDQPQSKIRLAVVTACTRSDGLPDFALNDVQVTKEEYENGVHYDLVEELLIEQEYEEPFVHFDQRDAPAFLLPAVRQYLGISQTQTK
jgi:hypothetical protein